MSASVSQTLSDALRALLGAQIASVVFVEDYVQIEVSDGRMSILEPLRLEGHGRTLTRSDQSFADELKACTGASMQDVQVDEDQAAVRLSNGKTLRITLSESTGTKETFIYQDGTGRMWVAGPAGSSYF